MEVNLTKKTAVFLALVLVFCSLVGCSNSDSQNEEKAVGGIWSIQKMTDEFGDTIESSQDIIRASFQGTYETKTTTGLEFDVSVNLRKRADFNHYIIEFELTENNTSKIQFEKTSIIKLKTKVGETVQEFCLSVEESSGNLSYGNEDFYINNDCGDYIFSNLYNGQDIKCIIEKSDSSVYSFELKSDNFNALCKANAIPLHYTEDITVKESVESLLSDNRAKTNESCNYLISKYESFKIVETKELNDLLNGVFLTIFLDPTDGDADDSRRWRIDKYSLKESIDEVLEFYSVPSGELKRQPIMNQPHFPYNIKIGNNLVNARNINYGTVSETEIRKITDNIFLSFSTTTSSDSDEISSHYSVFVYLGETFNENDFEEQIEYVLKNYVPEISC